MKSSDIAMIILIASLSVMLSFAIVNSIPFFAVSDDDRTVPVIQTVESDIAPPDTAVFNKDAINPTVQIVVTPNEPRETE